MKNVRFSWRKLSRIAHFCCTKGPHALNFAKKTFVYSHKTVKIMKVFSLESFSLYSIQECNAISGGRISPKPR